MGRFAKVSCAQTGLGAQAAPTVAKLDTKAPQRDKPEFPRRQTVVAGVPQLTNRPLALTLLAGAQLNHNDLFTIGQRLPLHLLINKILESVAGIEYGFQKYQI